MFFISLNLNLKPHRSNINDINTEKKSLSWILSKQDNRHF